MTGTLSRFVATQVVLVTLVTRISVAEEPRRDSCGDELPKGAVTRLGTSRLREWGSVETLRFLDAGTRILAGNAHAQTVTTWELPGGRQVTSAKWNVEHASRLALAPDGKQLAVGTYEGEALLIEIGSGAVLWRERHCDRVKEICFSDDGRLVASGGEIGDHDGNLRVWEAASGERRLNLPIPGDDVHTLDLSPAGDYVASGGCAGSCTIRETVNGEAVSSWKAAETILSIVQFSPDGQRIATSESAIGNAPLRLWEASTGEPIREYSDGGRGVHTIAFSPDGVHLAVGGESRSRRWAYEVRVLGVEGGETELTLTMGMHAAGCLAFSGDGRFLACGTRDPVLRVWDLSQAGKAIHPAGPESDLGGVAWSPDGSTLVTGGGDGTLRWWDAKTGTERRVLQASEQFIAQVEFSADGKTVVSGGGDDVARLWDASSGESRGSIQGGEFFDFSPDGLKIAYGGLSSPLQVRAFLGTSEDLEWGRHRVGDTKVYPGGIEFSPDGGYIAVESKHHLLLCDSATGAEVARFEGGQVGSIASFAFSPDGRTIAIAHWEGDRKRHALQIREVATWRPHFERDLDQVSMLAFSPDGDQLAAGATDGSVRILDPDTGEAICMLTWRGGPVRECTYSTDGGYLAVAYADSTVLLWVPPPRAEAKAPDSPDPKLGPTWEQLGSPDPQPAFAAVGRLVAAGDVATSRLSNRLAPCEDRSEEIAGWLQDLDAADSSTREAAMVEMASILAEAKPLLFSALAESPSAEAKERIDALLRLPMDPLPITSTEVLRTLRAIEVLERISTDAAQDVLRRLAGGAPLARISRAAKAALVRIDR